MPDKAWTDGLPLSAGYTSTLYFRNTPTLLNASRMLVFDWDGRFAQGDVASLGRDHLAEAHFMHIDGRLAIERVRQVPVYEEGWCGSFHLLIIAPWISQREFCRRPGSGSPSAVNHRPASWGWKVP